MRSNGRTLTMAARLASALARPPACAKSIEDTAGGSCRTEFDPTCDDKAVGMAQHANATPIEASIIQFDAARAAASNYRTRARAPPNHAP